MSADIVTVIMVIIHILQNEHVAALDILLIITQMNKIK